jgi:hypothetical protein
MSEDDFKGRILENLRDHPEGLTILSLAEATGINRITVSKYVMVMAVQGLISQRCVGTAKLCYFKGDFDENS